MRHIHTPANVTGSKLTGVPTHKAFAGLSWQATPKLTVTPNLSLASNRWTSNTAGTLYYKSGAFALRDGVGFLSPAHKGLTGAN